MHDGVKKPLLGKLPNSAPNYRNTVMRSFRMMIIFSLFTGLPAGAADDDYLKALESEADNTGSVAKQKSTAPQAQSVAPNPGNSNGKTEFEKLLEFELPSTFKFYTKLDAEDQNRVISRYNQEKKMSTASKLIFDLYFQRNK